MRRLAVATSITRILIRRGEYPLADIATAMAVPGVR